MTRFARYAVALASLTLTASAFAADAATSATAGSGRHGGNAAATASYNGDVGFARTDTRSGSVNLARGVAVGFDENGLALSVSNAIAPKHGPAVATNFNLSLGRDGVAHSTGVSVANGPLHREATAGGSTSSGPLRPTATSIASGQTDRYGRVVAHTNAYSSPRPQAVRVIHREARPVAKRVIVVRP